MTAVASCFSHRLLRRLRHCGAPLPADGIACQIRLVSRARVRFRLAAESPMNSIASLDVPKDVRTNGENSPNSVRAGPATPGSNDRPSLTVASPVRLRFDRYVIDLERGCV